MTDSDNSLNTTGPYTILGQGSYGIVVKPSLPNKNIPPSQNKVSKILLTKWNYDKTIRNIKTIIKNKIPSLYYPIEEYSHKYKVSNIKNKTLRNKIYATMMEDEDNEAGPDSRIFPVRMKNLGHSFRDISQSKELQDKLRELNPKIICLQALKLCNVVKFIRDSGYIHNDIRDANIMCDLETGEMTIIDFDLLKPLKDIKHGVTFNYNVPPEHALTMIPLYNKHMNVWWSIDRIQARLDKIYTAFKPYIKYTHSNLIEANMIMLTPYYGGNKEIYARYEENLTTSIMKYIDSYGLGTALEALLDKILVDSEIHTFLYDTIAMGLMNVSADERLTIEEAIDMLEKYIQLHYHDAHLEDTDVSRELARLELLAAVQNVGSLNHFQIDKNIHALAKAVNNVEKKYSGGSNTQTRRMRNKKQQRIIRSQKRRSPPRRRS